MSNVEEDLGKHRKLINDLIVREKYENEANGEATSKTLAKLKINIEELPIKCQSILKDISEKANNTSNLDPLILSLKQTKLSQENLESDYEILVLKQKNKLLQTKIDRNDKFLNELRNDLVEAKGYLASRAVNPSNIDQHVRNFKLKVASYVESYQKANAKLSKLNIPNDIMPKAIEALAAQLASLKAQEMELMEKVEEVTFTRQMGEKLNRLRK